MHNTNVAVALLYETQELGRQLRDALTSLGTPIVYEAAPANLDLAALQNSGARVVVVNLGSDDNDEHLDDVYGLLEDDRYSVVFNDAEASKSLSGWDQARWARHLAAKILGDVDIDPPRPEGAEAIPAPQLRHDADAGGAAVAEVDDVDMPQEPEANYDTRHRSIEAVTPDEHAPVSGNPLELLESRYDEMNQPATAAFPTPSPPPADAFDFSTLEALTGVPAPPAATTSALTLAPEFLDDESSLQASAAEPIEAPPAPMRALQLTEDPLAVVEMPDAPAVPADADDDFDLAALDKLFADDPHAPDIDSVPLEPDALESVSHESSALDVGDLGDFDALDSLHLDDATDHVDVPGTGTPGLSLMDDIAYEAAPLTKPAESAPSPTTLKLAAAADWSLEDMLTEGDAPPPPPPAKIPSGPADFGIEKVSAAEYLAPPTENTAAPVVPDDGFSLELMPMEEAVAPQAIEREVRETWLNPESAAASLPKIRRVWVLGASIGGPEAVREFLGQLPRDYPALFLLAQHMGVEFVDLMAQQMAKSTPLTVRTPTHGERVSHGEIVIVPTTHRLQIDPEGIVVLERTNDEGAYSPSIDRVLRDVADRYGANAGAIIFSGMTTDAVEGSKYLAEKGGTVYAQHPDTCVVSSMIDGVVEAGVVKFLGSPKELAERLLSESKKGKR